VLQGLKEAEEEPYEPSGEVQSSATYTPTPKPHTSATESEASKPSQESEIEKTSQESEVQYGPITEVDHIKVKTLFSLLHNKLLSLLFYSNIHSIFYRKIWLSNRNVCHMLSPQTTSSEKKKHP
jgi:hypothetical protein